MRAFRGTYLGVLIWSLLGGVLDAETFQCIKKIDAFDPADPTRQIGIFQPQSALEIEEFAPAAKMYRVFFKAPDGTEVHALCRPEDLGKTSPPPAGENAAEPTTETPSAPLSPNSSSQISPQNSSQPPIFTAVTQLDPSLWDTTYKKFALMHGSHGFLPPSLTDNSVSRSGETLTFMGNPVLETIVRFKDEKLQEMMLLLYGRGDAKRDLDEPKFKDLMKREEIFLDGWLKTKGVDAWVAENVADTKRKSWFKAPLRVDLEWSVTRNSSEKEGGFDVKKGFRTEFVRLVVSSYDGKQNIADLTKPNFRSSAKPAIIKLADLKGRIKREGNGDVYLDGVPMVDQGQKGYCVVASAERVMRYYGLDLDQNELAKVANTSTEGGTSTEAMFKALKKIGGQFSLGVRELKGFDFKDFLKEVESYNHLAKKDKKDLIELPRAGVMFDIGGIYRSMNADVLRQVRSKKLNDKTKFINDVADLIEKGAPALWSVTLGYVSETPRPPQGFGGHMRLIIGYNKKTSEIIYTDSWGVSHEFKRMPMDDAWFITDGLYSVLPST